MKVVGQKACVGCVGWAETERKRLREEKKESGGEEMSEMMEACFVTLGLVDRGTEERRRKVEG